MEQGMSAKMAEKGIRCWWTFGFVLDKYIVKQLLIAKNMVVIFVSHLDDTKKSWYEEINKFGEASSDGLVFYLEFSRASSHRKGIGLMTWGYSVQFLLLSPQVGIRT